MEISLWHHQGFHLWHRPTSHNVPTMQSLSSRHVRAWSWVQLRPQSPVLRWKWNVGSRQPCSSREGWFLASIPRGPDVVPLGVSRHLRPSATSDGTVLAAVFYRQSVTVSQPNRAHPTTSRRPKRSPYVHAGPGTTIQFNHFRKSLRAIAYYYCSFFLFVYVPTSMFPTLYIFILHCNSLSGPYISYTTTNICDQ